MGVHVLFVDDVADLRKLLKYHRKGSLTIVNAVVVVVAEDGRVVSGIVRQSSGSISVIRKPLLRPIRE